MKIITSRIEKNLSCFRTDITRLISILKRKSQMRRKKQTKGLFITVEWFAVEDQSNHNEIMNVLALDVSMLDNVL